MTTTIETAAPNATSTVLGTATCHLCPPEGGLVVATYSGDGPARMAGDRAFREARATGVPHHDHYDPELDAFVVIRHLG